MPTSARRAGNLPAEVTTFIGRRHELAELRKKLMAVRLVSLVGPGGVGKTRLAIRIATDFARRFRDSAWLVELAEVRDPALVSNATIAALDLRDQAATDPLDLLRIYLKEKELLLVLDNCEHVLTAAAQLVAEVIKAAPGVRVIATSREPLSVTGEHLLPVPPLELPSRDSSEPLARLRQNEAVMLFSDRAAASSGVFKLDASNQGAVVELCRRLDGLPLAIELAAVRTRVLSPAQILDRITDRFGLLTGGSRAALPRHQTLRTTIEWSYELLSAAERTLFRRLCTFAGRFSLEDVEAVCSDPAEATPALDLLSSLVDKSLVIKEDARDAAVYRLHETMREYARLQLQAAGEVESVGRRCLDYYRRSCMRLAGRGRYRLLEVLDWTDLEIDNIRAVLRHSLDGFDYSGGIDIASGLIWFWITRASTEGVRWLDELLAHDPEPEVHAWAYFVRGFLAVLQSDPAAARPALERAVAAARGTGQLDALSASLAMDSIAANMAGDAPSSRRLMQEARTAAQGLDDLGTTLMLHQAASLNALVDGDLDAITAAASEGARLSRQAGDLYSLDMMLMNQGFALVIARDFDEAELRFMEGLRVARQIDDRVAQSYLIGAIGCCAAASHDARRAARLLGAMERQRAEAGAGLQTGMAPVLDEARASATSALGEAGFEAEFKAGHRLTRDAAARLALGEPVSAGAAVPDQGGAAGPLGKREADVARLVASGLTNKEIGSRLFISERTVESHVRNILNKLGFNSRAQIAGWMAAPDQ